MLPAYLFSRKRKSILIFFNLLKKYTEKNISIEELWSGFDTGGHFRNIKTLYKYFHLFIFQLDEIIRELISYISSLESSFTLEIISPDKPVVHEKLKQLFSLIDKLTALVHRNNITGVILDDEKYFFLHCHLYQRINIYLLNTS